MALDQCLPGLVAGGQLSPERAAEAAGLYGDLLEVYRRQFGDQAAAAMASDAAVKALRVQAARKKRLALLQVQAQRSALMNMKRYGGGDPAGAGPIDPRAAIALIDYDAKAGFSSVEARRKAIKGRAHGLIDSILADHRHNLVGEVRNKAQLANVVRELFTPGSTRDAYAAELAGAWTRAADMLRGRYNAAGGAIGELKGWGLPQAHDSRAVGKAGYLPWRDFILPLLDRGRMIDDRTGAPFTDAALEGALRNVYETIRTDGWSKIKAGAAGGKMLANQNAEHRFLHFRDADAWMAYADRFGTGSPFDAMMGHVEAMSRDIAAMEILGPNPEATIRWLKDTVVKSAKLAGGDAGEAAERGASQLQRLWDEYTGLLRRPESRRIALAFGTVRSLQVASKLGSASLSAVSDLSFGAVTRRFNGLPASKMIGEYARLFLPGTLENRKQAVRAGLIAEEWANMAASQHRYMLEEVTGEVGRRLASGVLRLSGLARFTQAGRWAFGMEFLGHLTDQVGRSFDALEPALQRAFERHGIGAEGWDRIRKTPLEADRGVDWLYPRNIADQDLGDRLLELIHTETDFAVPVADLRTRALMHSAAPAGTWIGESIRSAFLFKGFGISVVLLHGRRIMEQAGPDAARYAAALFIAMTLGGAAALQLKELAKGKDPRDMTGDHAAQFWGAAALQGGGFGIYGDFLSATENRFGGGLAQTLAGPVVDTVQGVGALTYGNIAKAARGDDTSVGRDAVQLIKRETPGQSLWYTRLAFERLVADQLQQAADPNYRASWRRMERRAKDQGSSFYWEPGEAAPQRAPNLGSAAGVD